MSEFEHLDALIDTLSLDLQMAEDADIPVVPAMLIWDWVENDKGSFRLRIYPLHAGSPKAATYMLKKLIGVGTKGIEVDACLMYSPRSNESSKLYSLEQLRGKSPGTLNKLCGVVP